MTDADRRLLESATQIKDRPNGRGDALQEAFYLLRDTRGADCFARPVRLGGIPQDRRDIPENRALGEMTRVRAEMAKARRVRTDMRR